MTAGQHSDGDSRKESLEEAAQDGPLPGTTDPSSEDEARTREDYQRDEGVVPWDDNDLDPDRDLSPEERERAIAADETVGGIVQPGGRGG
jgi:hypothetical protein